MVYARSAAIRGEITFSDGMAEQKTFWDFERWRMAQYPPIAVCIL